MSTSEANDEYVVPNRSPGGTPAQRFKAQDPLALALAKKFQVSFSSLSDRSG
jgi:hypothetical protein